VSIITDIVKGVISPITGLIDELHTSDEEKAQIKSALAKVEHDLAAKVLEHEATLAESQASVIRAEAQGNFLQKSWRPITALTFIIIIANNYIVVPYVQAFGATVPVLEIPPGMWALLNVMIGGYVLGRSGEKIASTIKGAREG